MNTTKTALIFQGWFQKQKDNWYPWLRSELTKKQYVASIPELPTMQTESPKLDEQIEFLLQMNIIDHGTTIVGHSLGAVLAMKVAELKRYDKMILVAGWDYNDLTYEHRSFWKKSLNHKLIQKNVPNIHVISSDNDPYVIAFHAKAMSQRLNATFHLITNAKHFTTKDGITKIPKLLTLL